MTEQDEPIYDMQLRAAEVGASKLGFTPGPWVWTLDNELGREGTSEGVVEMVQVSEHKMIVVNAPNKALIAAAPDLYAALKSAQWGNYSEGRERCPDCGGASEEGHRKWCDLAAALAKADGGQGPPDQQATPAVEGREDGNE